MNLNKTKSRMKLGMLLLKELPYIMLTQVAVCATVALSVGTVVMCANLVKGALDLWTQNVLLCVK